MAYDGQTPGFIPQVPNYWHMNPQIPPSGMYQQGAAAPPVLYGDGYSHMGMGEFSGVQEPMRGGKGGVPRGRGKGKGGGRGSGKGEESEYPFTSHYS